MPQANTVSSYIVMLEIGKTYTLDQRLTNKCVQNIRQPELFKNYSKG